MPPLTLPESPKHDDLRGYLAELYARIISTPVPPDQLIGRYFRLRRQLPPGARGFLGATVYALLRRRIRALLLHQWAGHDEPLFEWPQPGQIPPVLTPFEEAALALYRWMAEDFAIAPMKALAMTHAALKAAQSRELPEGEHQPPPYGSPLALLKDYSIRVTNDPGIANARKDVQRAARLSMPVDLLQRWTKRFGAAEADALAESLAQPAPLDLRVNRVKGTREELAAKLAELGFHTEPTPYSPDGLRVTEKANLFRTPLFEDGWFEVQDEGSQLVALALDPRPNWRVLDACSGGGGKALHLAALMKNRGEVYAHDLDAERLEAQRKRLRRAGIHNVRIIEPGTAAQHGPYDAVLIDAPCLGLGTLRRNPDMAWRGPLEQRLKEMVSIQRACIEEYGKLLKPGGVLVYATCSLEPEETLELSEKIDEIVPGLSPSPISRALEHNHVTGLAKPGETSLTLLPSIHSTDGFFIARFEKR